jgi:hypothetical protein
MSAQVSLRERLIKVVVPTTAQGLGAVVIALVILAAIQTDQLLKLIGVGDIALTAAQDQLRDRFGALLTSPIASSMALVTFWASVGLVAYLVCWGAYNILIEARNEVTLTTAYTNRGHWRGHLETLFLKAVGAVLLIIVVTLMKPGLSLWIALATPALVNPGPGTVTMAVGAVLGLATQLYVIFALALVTFTPWYRPETFTDQ